MKESWRQRLSSLSRGEAMGLAIVVVITLVGAGLWYVRSLPRPVAIGGELRGSPRASAGPGVGPGSLSPSPVATLIVDVAGWVRKPGVYELTDGDRVIDALDSAGGAKKGADLTTLNLAAPLSDGQQIIVPEPLSKTSSGPPVGASDPSSALININTADATQLESLSGIGEVLAQRIIDYRTEHGPFATVDDLDNVSGIGPATLAEIRDQITV